jgi:RNA polymerase sigma-70 factor, ECF subfamily
MHYLAGDAGGTAILGDVATVPGPRAGLPVPAVRQGNSVARLRTVDREAAEELFNACYPRLAGWVRRLVDDDDTAHEIASEAFTRLLARWSGLDNPQSYLYMIATNLVRDHWRRSGRERRAIRTLSAAAPADPAYHPAQDVDVRALIEALPARLRSAFLLHYYAGFGIREVAAMLGRPEGTVKADLHHARARLKAALDDPRDTRGDAHG